jgi:hypothetical protein
VIPVRKILAISISLIILTSFSIALASRASAASDLYLRWYHNEAYCVTDPGNSTVIGTHVDMEQCHSYTPGGQWGLRFVTYDGTFNWYEFVTSNNMCMKANALYYNVPIYVDNCHDSTNDPTELFTFDYNPYSGNSYWGGVWSQPYPEEAISLQDSLLTHNVINEIAKQNGSDTDQDMCLTKLSVTDEVVACHIL